MARRGRLHLEAVGPGETLRVSPPVVVADAACEAAAAPGRTRGRARPGRGGAAGDDAAAIALLAAHADRSWRTRALLADALRVAGRRDEARAAYEAALAEAGEPAPAALLADLAAHLASGPPADRGAAAAAWRRYLAQHPSGRAAPAAHAALAALDPDGAAAHVRALVEEHPDSPEATRALAQLGRALLAAERWDEAATLFARFRDDPRPARAETALVGLARACIAQGRLDEARVLLATHAERFPAGHRAAEAARLRAALGE